jgi:hypothetical protein
MRFIDAYAAAPVCSPIRCAALTGQALARIEIDLSLPRAFLPQGWHMGNRLAGAVREGKWKMIRNYHDVSLDILQLAERHKQKNLAKKNSDIAKDLNQKLSSWLLKTIAPMPPNVSG